MAVQGDLRVGGERKRCKRYGPEVLKPLKRIWILMDCACGKRLVAGIEEMIEALERHGELHLTAKVRQKLLQISASSVDRLLAPEKRRRAQRLKARTKPGSLLKSQIPIRTHAQWDENLPGFVEIDLVAHDGGCGQGDFAQTLDVTDVCTGWSVQRAVLNKAHCWVFEALQDIGAQLPFALKGVDSDNGSEFINHHLKAYCEKHQLTFTRSRPYHKNDTCYVEQKNYSIVRRAVGYGRFEGPCAVERLNELYFWVQLRQNFFLPSMKLRHKERQGSRIIKRYEAAKTPYRRVLESATVDKVTKARLRARYRELNPVVLDRNIRAIQRALGPLRRKVAIRQEPPNVVPVDSGQRTGKPVARMRKREEKGRKVQILF